MNVFKNKKRWQNKKNVKKRKKRALNKKRKKTFFYIYAPSNRSRTVVVTTALAYGEQRRVLCMGNHEQASLLRRSTTEWRRGDVTYETMAISRADAA